MVAICPLHHLPDPHLVPPSHLHAQWVDWVPAPKVDTRGTWTILQSCLITIFFCTATSLHLNVPRERHGDWRRAWTRFCWMTANTLAPEICMCIAMTQWLEAHIVLRDIDELCDQHGVPNPRWTMTHAFYYNMRGFRYHPPPGAGWGRSHQSLKAKTLKLKHMEEIVKLDLLDYIDKPKDIITEYSKQDRLAKTIAVAQALWFLLQTFARMPQHLPTSPLEITAVAYIACTLFSWMLWFQKPQDVGFQSEVTAPEFSDVIRRSRRRYGKNSEDDSKEHQGWKQQLPNIKREYRFRDKVWLCLTWLFTAALFGGLHLLAWRYEFPSAEEQVMWRVSSVAIMALPPVFYVWEIARYLRFGGSRSVDPLGLVIMLAYVMARVYNLFEVFFSLRLAPVLLYKTVQWTSRLPHF